MSRVKQLVSGVTPGLRSEGFSNFEAANWSPDRATIYYPFVESDKAVDSWTRGELMKKSCWAYDNNGYVRGLLNSAARMCARLMPQADTRDLEWNKLADAEFARATGNAEVFDITGKLNWDELIYAIFLGSDRLGDCGVALGRTEDFQPRVRFYEGYSIGDDADDKSDRFKDGILTDKHGKAQKYRIITADGHKDFKRKDFVYFADHERPGQRRGLPATYHMLNYVHDTKDIMRFWNGGIKAASQVAMQIVNSKKDGGPKGWGNNLVNKDRNESSGSVARQGPVTVDQLYNQSQIMELGEERIELLHDQRPAPSQMQYLDYQKRDMSIGYGRPVEDIWDLRGLNSAAVRSVGGKTQQFIDRRQDWILRQGVCRLRNWIVSLAIKGGRLPECKDPDWWKHEWFRGAKQSIDFAKDGRALLEMVNRGELSPDRYHAMTGTRVEDEDAKTVATWQRRKAMCEQAGIPFHQIFPPAPGTPVGAEISPEQMEEIKDRDDETKA